MSKISNFFLFLIIVGILGAAYVMLIPPTWVIDKQLGALKAGDINKAYAYTSEDFQKTITIDTFKAFVDQNPALQDSHGMAINEELIDKEKNNALIVKGILRTSEGKQIPIEYSLIRDTNINGLLHGWKIQTMKIQDQGGWRGLPQVIEDPSQNVRAVE